MSVYKNAKSPYYQFDFQIGGRRFFGSTRTRNSKDAEAAERELKAKAKADIEAERRTGHEPLTLDFAAGRYWLEIGQHHRDHKGTWNGLTLLNEFFGKTKRLDEIADADVVALVTWRRAQTVKRRGKKQISNATVNRSTVEPLRKLFMRAKSIWRYSFPREPVWSAHRLKEPPERVRELHTSEATAFDKALRPDYEPWFRFATASGLRLAETLIKWEHVNWEARMIRLTGKRGLPVSTPITAEVASIIKPLIGHHPEAVFTYVCRKPRPGQRKGRRYPISYAGAKSEWQALRKRAGVKAFRFHDIRHDMATKLLRQTGNLKLVSIALNHTDVKTTSRYAHVMDGQIAEALQHLSKSRKKSRTKAAMGDQPIDVKG